MQIGTIICELGLRTILQTNKEVYDAKLENSLYPLLKSKIEEHQSTLVD